MERKVDKIYVLHMRDATDLVLTWTREKNLDDFKTDLQLQSAVVRQIEIIGEAAKNISPDLKVKFPDIPWRPISDARNRLIHGYFTVDDEKVWDIVTKDIPKLRKQISDLLQKF